MITVLFQTESHFPVSRDKIREAITLALEKKVHRATEVSISIVGDRRMKQLNREYRHLDETTDVLSFPQNEAAPGAAQFIHAPDHVLRLGDIVVSFPQAVLEASEKNMLVDDMVIFLALHGLDHLLGIHHPT